MTATLMPNDVQIGTVVTAIKVVRNFYAALFVSSHCLSPLVLSFTERPILRQNGSSFQWSQKKKRLMPEIWAASLTVIHSGPMAGRGSLALATSSGSTEVAATSVASASSDVIAAISSALGIRSHAGAVSGWILRVAAMEQNGWRFARLLVEALLSYPTNRNLSLALCGRSRPARSALPVLRAAPLPRLFRVASRIAIGASLGNRGRIFFSSTAGP